MIDVLLAMKRVGKWMDSVFTHGLRFNPRERALRVMEEANEFGQALNVSRLDAMNVADHVFMREKGTPEQEAAGVLVTLLAACVKLGIPLEMAFLKEMERIEHPDFGERIRAAQDRKRAAGLSSDGLQREQLTKEERIEKMARYLAAGMGYDWDRLVDIMDEDTSRVRDDISPSRQCFREASMNSMAELRMKNQFYDPFRKASDTGW